jgi:hypothetical protein
MVPEMSVKPNITHTRCHINKRKESGVDVIHRLYKLRLCRSAVIGVLHMANQTVFSFVKKQAKENHTQTIKKKKIGILLIN